MQENPETTAETIPENQGKEPDPEPQPEPVPQTETVPQTEENPAPKRRGRPEGAKDRAPRKKKVVVVVEEHITQEPQENVAQNPFETPPHPPKKKKLERPDSPPHSPWTLIRDAAEHILKLKNVTKMARKAHLQETYTKRLHSLS
jgi:hypothetical protein